MGIVAAYVQQKSILSNVRRSPWQRHQPASLGRVRASRRQGACAKAAPGRTKVVQRDENTGQLAISKARFEAVILAAERSGLLSGKSGRIGCRVSPALVKQAKRQTGIVTDSDLIEFALASVALEDNFAVTFKESRGKVDPALKLGF
jgi:hypothetical protein